MTSSSETSAPARSGRPAHSRTAVLGMLLLLLPFVAFVIYGFATGIADDSVFFLIPAVVLGIATFGLRRSTALWVSIVALVLVVAGGVLFFWIAIGLTHVNSPLDFVPGVSFVLGLFVGLGGIIASLVARRRRNFGIAPSERPIRLVAIGLVVAALVFSGVSLVATRKTVSANDAAGAVVIEMKAFEFEPIRATAEPGSKLLVKNLDGFVHDYTVAGLDISFELNPGSERLIDLGSVAPGTYTVLCKLHSNSGKYLDSDGNLKSDAPSIDEDLDSGSMLGELIVS